MKKISTCLIILAMFFISCKNKITEVNVESPVTNEVSSEALEAIEINAKINSNEIIEQLQGKWKEDKYPYRVIEFKNSTAKFIEEGIPGKLKFQNFEISTKCLFNVNNIKEVKSGDIILSLPGEQKM